MFLKKLHQFKLTFLLLLTSQLIAPQTFAGMSICSFLLGNTPISYEALQALHTARTHFKIEVLHKVVGDKSRVVILAGETHFKTNAGQNNGLKLMQHFDLRGLEGSDLENNLTARMLGAVVDAMNFIATKNLSTQRQHNI